MLHKCHHWAVMQVRAALASKVSRERFGTEVEGMMSGLSLLVHHYKIHVNLWASIDLLKCILHPVQLVDKDGQWWQSVASKSSSL